MEDFKDFLRILGKKPGFYLSPGPSGSSKSISHLRTFLNGIQVGQHLKHDPSVLDAFTFWICIRYQITMGASDGFGHILERVGGDDAAAFDLFFELFEEYLQERQRIGYEEMKARYLAMERAK
jgi:hypothetical protein